MQYFQNHNFKSIKLYFQNYNFKTSEHISKIIILKTSEYICFQAFTVLCNLRVCARAGVCVCVKKKIIYFPISFYPFPTSWQSTRFWITKQSPKPCSQGERRTVTAGRFLSNARRVVNCQTWLLTQHFSTPLVHCQGLYKYRQRVRSTAYYRRYHTTIG